MNPDLTFLNTDPEYQKLLDAKIKAIMEQSSSNPNATVSTTNDLPTTVPTVVPPSVAAPVNKPFNAKSLETDLGSTYTNLPTDTETYNKNVATAKENAVPLWKTALGAFSAGMQGMATGGQNLSVASQLGQSWEKQRDEAGKQFANPQEAAKAKLDQYIKMRALGTDEAQNKLAGQKFEEEKRQFGIKQALEQNKLVLDQAKQNNEILKATEKLTADQKEKMVKLEGDLRKEIDSNPETKNFVVVKSMYNNIKTAAKSGTAAADMSLVFAYMKMLDPSSTVREGEYANAARTTGVPGRIVNIIEKAESGQILTDQQRKDFVAEAGNLYKTSEKAIGGRFKFYEDVAKKQGLDINNVIYNPVQYSGNATTLPTNSVPISNAGKIVNVQGKKFKVGLDGDTLIPME